MKTLILFVSLMVASLIVLMSCDSEINPCDTRTDLEFDKLSGEVRYDERFKRNVIVVFPPCCTDYFSTYIPCTLPEEFEAGSKIIFTGSGHEQNDLKPKVLVAGEKFYTVILSKSEVAN